MHLRDFANDRLHQVELPFQVFGCGLQSRIRHNLEGLSLRFAVHGQPCLIVAWQRSWAIGRAAPERRVRNTRRALIMQVPDKAVDARFGRDLRRPRPRKEIFFSLRRRRVLRGISPNHLARRIENFNLDPRFGFLFFRSWRLRHGARRG